MMEKSEAVKEEEVDLPGFRFHPTDEELVGFYLRQKVEKKTLSIDIIKDVDIYKYDPWDLPRLIIYNQRKTNIPHFPNIDGNLKACIIGSREKEWYFFCLRGRKYRNSIRPNRVTGSGFWKATGIDRPIYSSTNDINCIGLKKSLVYYRGSAGKGTKTDWMMHEFRLPSKNDTASSPRNQEAEIWTICRIFKRNISLMKKYTQNWKEAITNKQMPANSSSKANSLESNARDTHTNEDYPGDYYDTRNFYQILGCPAIQEPISAFQPNIIPVSTNTNTDEMFKDGNWDELGRIMESVEHTHY